MSSNPAKQYADIMGYQPDGNFLYKPQDAHDLPLGSVGYFDRNEDWVQLANLMEEGNPESNGYGPFHHTLQVGEVKECFWDKQSGDSEVGQSSRATVEASGAMAAAPVDVSAQMKRNSSSTGSAALITNSVVRKHKLKNPFKHEIMDWVDENAAEIIKPRRRRHEIKNRGLFVIMAVWVTDECAIKLTTEKNRDVDFSLDLGATGIGKVGGGIGAYDKLSRENWATYPPNKTKNGYVVSFAGVEYSLKWLAKKRSVPVDVERETISLPVPKPGPIDGTPEGQETSESEADSEGEDVGESVCNAFGMDDSDDEEYAQQQKEARKVVMEKLVQIRQIENEEQRKEELTKLVQEDLQARAIIGKWLQEREAQD
ncbi:uncharacterized protein KD926_003721 [Aspergillus affinis]|uniref:uncharacterized protein n=1 Tax=Aspergillus affinis TaxID=1070780 RepID=UPI0022FF1AB8|nr:uncharacterized protein KD926_003721 [Aspergillus affinis]KAI9035331.1 hypothetical protein KD926_003721 [Aspergillus affinis]